MTIRIPTLDAVGEEDVSLSTDGYYDGPSGHYPWIITYKDYLKARWARTNWKDFYGKKYQRAANKIK